MEEGDCTSQDVLPRCPSPSTSYHLSLTSAEHVGNQRSKRVVVVGGGIAGSILVKALQYHADVVLIDQKEYFEVPWATMRSMVEPPLAERAIINHRDYLVKGTLITSTAVDVTETDVVTADGHHVPYDYLVIATGHSSPSPKCREDRMEEFKEAHMKLTRASAILVVGGGPTGVELASDIAAEYPDKKVTLVHRGPRLLGFLSNKAGSKALEWLRSKNVDVLLDQHVNLESSPANGIYLTSVGEAIAADARFICAKRPLGSSWLKDSVLKDGLDMNGQLMVDEYLRVAGRDDVFAIGDINDAIEKKQGTQAQKQAMVVAKNLKARMRGSMRMGKYKESTTITTVSLGKKDALTQLPFTTMTGYLPGLTKSRDVFLRKTRKKLLGVDSSRA